MLSTPEYLARQAAAVRFFLEEAHRLEREAMRARMMAEEAARLHTEAEARSRG